ncbi:MAG: GTPase ObgE [Deltaproteobacteria bacterium HGW-Deltaproteobacteria-15]|jgi:GTP-binding protein|nr:MAG: GTPase ObgE [Deltaproteobacteria bacterium HGW-Deltaproteobacteria-15]
MGSNFTNKSDFLDEVIITAISGNGGRGCISFRRARFIPKGGPDGGDGGNGGSVVIKAAAGLNSLAHFRHKRYFKAQNGSPGSGQNRTGKDGKDTIIEVPPGTLVYDKDTGEMLYDLMEEDQEVLLLPGGKGGRGNQHFATPTRRVPRIAQPGLPGGERKLRLSLKYIADVGIIGFPNAGKSTLLSSLTMARPRIDDYPFTTIHPHLGVLDREDGKRITLADIPGLIEGAGQGRGLGHRFLKHIERTRLLLHLLDITYVPEQDLLEDFLVLRRELEEYDPSLLRKEQMVAINKIDLERGRDVGPLMKRLEKIGFEVFAISAATGEGLDILKEAFFRRFFDGRKD